MLARNTIRFVILKDKDYQLPIISVVADESFLYDEQIGVMVRGVNGRAGNGQSTPCNWNMDWERPVNFSFITSEGEMALCQDVNLEMAGGWSRAWEPHSFKLIVEDQAGNLSYLAAFSGQIDDRDTLPGFVPPVFSYLSPQGYFKQEEANISAINKQISDLESSHELASLRQSLATIQRQSQEQIEEFKTKMADAKLLRDSRRQQGSLTPAEEAQMIKESQHLKAELRRLKARCKADVDAISAQYNTLTDKIKTLKSERQQRSDSLQHWLFQHFVMLNGRGESKNLIDIFKNTAIGIPPSGSGECCEPRLLQYAFKQGLKPRLMAMMWVGESPRGVIRKHGSYYPACQGRCKPILDWMLQGIEVEPDHIDSDATDRQLKILYSDSDIVVVGKPEGMLSVPGKTRFFVKPNLMQCVSKDYPVSFI